MEAHYDSADLGSGRVGGNKEGSDWNVYGRRTLCFVSFYFAQTIKIHSLTQQRIYARESPRPPKPRADPIHQTKETDVMMDDDQVMSASGILPSSTTETGPAPTPRSDVDEVTPAVDTTNAIPTNAEPGSELGVPDQVPTPTEVNLIDVSDSNEASQII